MRIKSSKIVKPEQDAHTEQQPDKGILEGLAETDKANEEGLNAVGRTVAEALARGGLKDGVE